MHKYVNFSNDLILFNFLLFLISHTKGVHCTLAFPQFHESSRSWIPTLSWVNTDFFFYLILMAEEMRTFFVLYTVCMVFIFAKIRFHKNRCFYFKVNLPLFQTELWQHLYYSVFKSFISLTHCCSQPFFFLNLFFSFFQSRFRNGAEKRHITSWSC